mmetsp:Transcript_47638/g.137076  ORF Transcript_47638/g.137076 Transcript_47638/m.137076 type:complete len:384 (+) Transcript_47638:243-1394(+)
MEPGFGRRVRARLLGVPSGHLELAGRLADGGLLPGVPRWTMGRASWLGGPQRVHCLPSGLMVRGGGRDQRQRLHEVPQGHVEPGPGRVLREDLHRMSARHVERPGRRRLVVELPKVPQGHVGQHHRREPGERLHGLPPRDLPERARPGEQERLHPVRSRELQRGGGLGLVRHVPAGHVERRVRDDALQPLPRGHVGPVGAVLAARHVQTLPSWRRVLPRGREEHRGDDAHQRLGVHIPLGPRPLRAPCRLRAADREGVSCVQELRRGHLRLEQNRVARPGWHRDSVRAQHQALVSERPRRQAVLRPISLRHHQPDGGGLGRSSRHRVGVGRHAAQDLHRADDDHLHNHGSSHDDHASSRGAQGSLHIRGGGDELDRGARRATT